MIHPCVKTTTKFGSRISVLLTLAFLTTISFAQPREITWDDLEELKEGKVPKNAEKQFLGGLFSSDMYSIEVYTPRAQAAHFAKAAKENYIKLDSSTYFPALFNSHIEIEVRNLMASSANTSIEPKDMRQINRGLVVIDEEPFEPDTAIFIESTFSNAYGADFTNIDATFYFPLSLFDGTQDIKMVIFDNQGKVERKLKKKDIKKLE